VLLACLLLLIGVAVAVVYWQWQVTVPATTHEGYYAAVQGKSGDDLRQALHNLIRQHTRVSYASLWQHYRATDCRPDGTVWDMYGDIHFAKFKSVQGGPPGRMGSYLTREHSWPKTSWGGAVNDAYSDLFHVLPGDAHTNGQKGIRPPGETDGSAKSWGVTKVGAARAGLGYAGEVFEPGDEYKGDFARTYFYFLVCYLTGDDALPCTGWPLVAADGTNWQPWALAMLRRWHEQDPVSSKETGRNDAVFRIQHNRNPFIDHPEWVAAIWE